MFTNKLVAAFIVTAVIVSLLYTPVLAGGIEGQDSGDGPSWGYGDDKHIHTGPPGQVDKDEKPGWGQGDENHNHSGPPGKPD